jgi:hypothetical protein
VARIEEAPGPPPDGERAIERVEQALIGDRLPDPYRRFLLTHNGGTPDPAGFVYADESGPYTDSEVARFMGIGDTNYDLEEWSEIYRGRMPEELLPIAVDPGGNVICLAIAGANRGAVYFWDHEAESDPPTWSNVHRLADSFDAFLANLQA